LIGRGPDQGGTRRGADAAASAPDVFQRADPPLLSLRLSPNRSLGAQGNGIVIALAAAGLSLPLMALAGSRAAWGMLPFLLVPLIALYLGFKRNFWDARLCEEVKIWPDLITVVRREPGGAVHRWHANPYWVRVRLIDGAKVERYLTVKGNGREIELGGFLSPWEREDLARDIERALADARAHARGPADSGGAAR
jgi:uncharacterized membrane protein